MALIVANQHLSLAHLERGFFRQVALVSRSNLYSLLRAMLVMASRKGLRPSNV